MFGGASMKSEDIKLSKPLVKPEKVDYDSSATASADEQEQSVDNASFLAGSMPLSNALSKVRSCLVCANSVVSSTCELAQQSAATPCLSDMTSKNLIVPTAFLKLKCYNKNISDHFTVVGDL